MYFNEDLMLLANLAITMITPCSIVSYLVPDINFILWRARSSCMWLEDFYSANASAFTFYCLISSTALFGNLYICIVLYSVVFTWLVFWKNIQNTCMKQQGMWNKYGVYCILFSFIAEWNFLIMKHIFVLFVQSLKYLVPCSKDSM